MVRYRYSRTKNGSSRFLLQRYFKTFTCCTAIGAYFPGTFPPFVKHLKKTANDSSSYTRQTVPVPLGGQPVYGGGGGGREEVALPSSCWLRSTQFICIGFVGMRVKPCNFSLALFANQPFLGLSPFYFVYWLLAQ